MNTFEFDLKFAIPVGLNTSVIDSKLFESGCDDALVGMGRQGRLALAFSREDETAYQAVTSAISDVMEAVPQARLIEVAPDLVGVTDIAELFSFSRQNMQKLLKSHHSNFPLPLHEGRSALWHLCEVVEWFQENRDQPVDPALREVAEASRKANMVRELSRFPQDEIGQMN